MQIYNAEIKEHRKRHQEFYIGSLIIELYSIPPHTKVNFTKPKTISLQKNYNLLLQHYQNQKHHTTTPCCSRKIRQETATNNYRNTKQNRRKRIN